MSKEQIAINDYILNQSKIFNQNADLLNEIKILINKLKELRK